MRLDPFIQFLGNCSSLRQQAPPKVLASFCFWRAGDHFSSRMIAIEFEPSPWNTVQVLKNGLSAGGRWAGWIGIWIFGWGGELRNARFVARGRSRYGTIESFHRRTIIVGLLLVKQHKFLAEKKSFLLTEHRVQSCNPFFINRALCNELWRIPGEGVVVMPQLVHQLELLGSLRTLRRTFSVQCWEYRWNKYFTSFLATDEWSNFLQYMKFLTAIGVFDSPLSPFFCLLIGIFASCHLKSLQPGQDVI